MQDNKLLKKKIFFCSFFVQLHVLIKERKNDSLKKTKKQKASQMIPMAN